MQTIKRKIKTRKCELPPREVTLKLQKRFCRSDTFKKGTKLP
jgi:hypothetical protein